MTVCTNNFMNIHISLIQCDSVDYIVIHDSNIVQISRLTNLRPIGFGGSALSNLTDEYMKVKKLGRM